MNQEHLARMIRNSIDVYGDRTSMRYKTGNNWYGISYKEMGVKIDAIAGALMEHGVAEGEMVGIFSDNRPEWALADFAIHSVRGVAVPIYATNTAKQAEYIINDAGIRILFAGTKDHLEKINQFIRNNRFLKKVILFDDGGGIAREDAVSLKEFIKIGESSKHSDEIKKRCASGSADDLATLIYTSGTTGDPKGVMLCHGNFAHQFYAIDQNFNLTKDDRSLCFLPLSHAYERTWSYYVFRQGTENNYISDPKQIVEYMSDVRPSAMVSVPRLYEKIYSTVFERLGKASSVKRQLFQWALKIGSRYNYRKRERSLPGPCLALRYKLADRLVLGGIRDIVGGYKNFFSAGGAPLSQDIEEFFFSAGLLICQGYGLTESSPMISYNSPGAFKFGTVGKAVPGCEVKIGDDGEILARGPNIMKGYYNKPEETEATVVNGWLKTGDVGIIDSEGFIRITDRIKDLIITSQGKNVAPQHIETIIGMDHFIEQIATIGDKRNYIAALIVPSFPALEEYARDKGIPFSSRQDLIADPEIVGFYRRRIDELSRDLANYEKVKRFTLLDREFTQEGGELTPTLKIKRKVIAEKYRDKINAMYAGE